MMFAISLRFGVYVHRIVLRLSRTAFCMTMMIMQEIDESADESSMDSDDDAKLSKSHGGQRFEEDPGSDSGEEPAPKKSKGASGKGIPKSSVDDGGSKAKQAAKKAAKKAAELAKTEAGLRALAEANQNAMALAPRIGPPGQMQVAAPLAQAPVPLAAMPDPPDVMIPAHAGAGAVAAGVHVAGQVAVAAGAAAPQAPQHRQGGGDDGAFGLRKPNAATRQDLVVKLSYTVEMLSALGVSTTLPAPQFVGTTFRLWFTLCNMDL